MKIRAYSGTPDFDTETVQLLQIQSACFQPDFSKILFFIRGNKLCLIKSAKPLEIHLDFCYNFIVSFIDCIFAVIVFRLHSV